MRKPNLTKTLQLQNDEQLNKMFESNERFIRGVIAFCMVQFVLLLVGYFHF